MSEGGGAEHCPSAPRWWDRRSSDKERVIYIFHQMTQPAHPLSRQARTLRLLHTSIGIAELGCLGYVWFCALSRRHDRWLKLSAGALTGEGVALMVAKGCPLGVFQRRAGDDVPMFELWFGPRLAPFAIPSFTVIALAGLRLVVARPPRARLRPAHEHRH